MSYRKYLTRYGSPAETGEIRFSIYLTDPAKLTTPKDIVWRDKHIAEDITRLETVLEALRDYRKDLAARYGELETMTYSRLLKIKRETHWKGPITYTVTITKIREDGTKETELLESFQGIDRHKAIARYHELRKQHPGITCEMDIKKGSWER